MFDFNNLPNVPKFDVYDAETGDRYTDEYCMITHDGLLVNECACLPKGKFIVEFENGEKYRW